MMKSGLNLYDLLELSPVHRQVVRVLLREKLLSEAEIRTLFPDLPPDKLGSVLQELVQLRWVQCDDSDIRRYRLEFAFTPSPDDTPSLWEKIEALRRPVPREGYERDIRLQRGGKRKLPRQIWDKLDDG
jgi:hypothetical protein